MAKKTASDIFQVNSSSVDGGFSIRRTNRFPIDETSVFNTYQALLDEMQSEVSSIYKGQIVAVKDPTDNGVVAYLIKNDRNLKNTYYAERIIDLTYISQALIGKYVRPGELGTTYTGVGQWYDAHHNIGEDGEAVATVSYSEVFNDYVNNIAGDNTTDSAKYAHAEGTFTSAKGNASHSEGIGTSTVGDGSHAEGIGTTTSSDASHAEGAYSFAMGIGSHAEGSYTQTQNDSEHASGIYNKSYTGDEISTIKNDFESGRGGGLSNYDSTYATVFTIGDGKDDDNRHNIMDIRQNGQMYYGGNVIVGGEVVAPVSYSYVASLGPTAYLTTILSALLTQPQYTKPTVSANVTNRTTFEVGSTVTTAVTFSASNVTTNPSSLAHGNCAGLSTGITQIKYTYNAGDNGKKGKDIDSEGTFSTKLVGNWSNKNASSSSVSLGKFTDVTEGTYNTFKGTNYTYEGASQMYFQQLMEKSTYVEANGVAPTNKFDNGVGTLSTTASFTVAYKYYYKVDATNAVPTCPSNMNGFTPQWMTSNLGVGSTQSSPEIKTSSTTQYRLWIAIPEFCEITRYNSNAIPSNLYVYYKNSLGSESALDTGKSTDIPLPANALYEFTTAGEISTCHRKYKVYCVHCSNGIAQGTIRFAFKRNS